MAKFTAQIRLPEGFDHHRWAESHGISIIADRTGDGQQAQAFLVPEPGIRELQIELHAENPGDAEMHVRRALPTGGVLLALRQSAAGT